MSDKWELVWSVMFWLVMGIAFVRTCREREERTPEERQAVVNETARIDTLTPMWPFLLVPIVVLMCVYWEPMFSGKSLVAPDLSIESVDLERKEWIETFDGIGTWLRSR